MKNLLLLFIFLPFIIFGQIKDTLFGSPKYVKESVVYLTNKQNNKLFEEDGDYGHATIPKPENYRARFVGKWFDSGNVGFINCEVFYTKDGRISKENWFAKNESLLSTYRYQYDKLGRKTRYVIEGNDFVLDAKYKFVDQQNIPVFVAFSKGDQKSSISKTTNTYIRNNNNPLNIYEYDSISRTEKIYSLSNLITCKKTENGKEYFTKCTDSVYHKMLIGTNQYDQNNRQISKTTFRTDYDGRLVKEATTIINYDKLDRIIKASTSNDGKIESYQVFSYLGDSDIVEREENYYKNILVSWTQTTVKDNYITGKQFFDKERKDHVTKVLYRYKFDKEGNWIEMIKNVDGVDLYKWIREIQYY